MDYCVDSVYRLQLGSIVRVFVTKFKSCVSVIPNLIGVHLCNLHFYQKSFESMKFHVNNRYFQVTGNYRSYRYSIVQFSYW